MSHHFKYAKNYEFCSLKSQNLKLYGFLVITPSCIESGGNCKVAFEVASNRISGKIQQPCDVCVFEPSTLYVDSRDL